MARVQNQPILSQIRTARTFAEQNAAIRSLKNEVVGHVQRQQQCVELGALETLVQALQGSRVQSRPNGKDTTKSHLTTLKPLSEEESVRLQVIQLLASFANGGPPFLSPLHSSGAIPALLANLCPTYNHPRIVLATLRALISFAEASESALPPCPVTPALLAGDVFAPAHLDSLYRILVEPGSFPSVSTGLVNCVAELVGRLCREESHQLALASSGILDALATKLAGFVVARGQVVPGADFVAQNEGILEFMPEPAPSGTKLVNILDAISAIMGDSRLRACMLLYSPSILAVFPNLEFGPPAREIKAVWDAMESVGLGSSRPRTLGAIEHLLPIVPGQPKSFTLQMSPYPPLGTARDHPPNRSRSHNLNVSGWDASRFEPFSTSSGEGSFEDAEVPLIPWLIHLARSSRSLESLAAASVLTSLYRVGFTSRAREAAMGALVVPPLMEMLGDRDSDATGGTTSSTASPTSAPAVSAWVDSGTATRWAVTERALDVLARLTMDNEPLQKAAFDCDAVKKICRILKDAYEPMPARGEARPWSTCPDEQGGRAEVVSLSCSLGSRGQLPLQRHRYRLRESALKLIASLMSFKEEYRKAFVAQDIISYLVESLSESPSTPGGAKDRPARPSGSRTATEERGGTPDVSHVCGHNPMSVLIAACHAIRMLARSTFILRTTLQDAGVAQPLFRLTCHPDVQVQVAATGVVCNLMVDISPMREPLVELGIVKVLCEHAHSVNPALRLNAVWSLKHFVNGSSSQSRKACVEELQPGWLVQLICDDTEDEALYARSRIERQNTPRPSAFDADEDVVMDQLEEDRTKAAWPSSSLYGSASPRLSHERSRTGRLRHAEAKISALRDAELNPVRKARSDDLAIQEQALDFIRNLLTPPSSGAGPDTAKEMTDMIDYLFSELGQDRLFDILATKLRPRVLRPFSRRFSGGGGGGVAANSGNMAGGAGAGVNSSVTIYPQPKIIEPVVYILVHMAASAEIRHRQLVMAQTDMLRMLSTHLASRDKQVRVALCHLLVNLTTRDLPADVQTSERRADELRRLGLLTKLESLEQDDTELDVRERAKVAVYQMKLGAAAGAVARGNHQ